MSFEKEAPGLLRIRQIIGDRNASPPIDPIIPVSRAAWYAGVKSGRFPKPVKRFGSRITCWSKEDIRKLAESTN